MFLEVSIDYIEISVVEIHVMFLHILYPWNKIYICLYTYIYLEIYNIQNKIKLWKVWFYNHEFQKLFLNKYDIIKQSDNMLQPGVYGKITSCIGKL